MKIKWENMYKAFGTCLINQKSFKLLACITITANNNVGIIT